MNRRLLVPVLVIGFALAIMVQPMPVRAGEKGSWVLSFHGGLSAAGELFRATSETSRDWITPDGRRLQGVTLETEIEEFFGGGLRVGTYLTPKVFLQAGLTVSDLNITAVHRTAADAFLSTDYDQMFYLGADLLAAYDLVAEGNTPYIQAGVGLANLAFEGRADGDSLDQTNVGVVLGGGLRVRSLEGVNIDLDIRATLVSPDLSNEAARFNADTFDANGTVALWQLGVNWNFTF